MIDWVTSIMNSLGYVGVGALMFLENLYPPIPSEIIMPLAGFTAARGDLNFFLVALAGTAGSILGAVFWYFIGRFVGEERIKTFADRYGKWITLSRKDIDKSLDVFERHDKTAVLVGRVIPAIRTVISIPAGVTRMPFSTFLLFTTIGTAIWTFALAYAGLLLDQNWEVVGMYVGPVSTAIIAFVIFYYIFRVVRQWKEEKEAKK